MTIALSPVYGAGAQFFDDNGDPLAGGYLYTFLAGTTTPATTFTSSSGLVANTNPIVLDAAGRPMDDKEIWLTVGTAYKFVLKTSAFVEVWTQDNLVVWSPPDLTASLANNTNKALGDAMVAFRQANSTGLLPGAIGKTVHDKLTEFVSVKDFGAKGDGVTADDAAIVAACASGRQVYFPAGTYLISSPLQIGGITGMEWRGAGQNITIIKFDPDAAWKTTGILFDACNMLMLTGITFEQAGTVLDDSGTLYPGVQFSGHNGDSDDVAAHDCGFINSYYIGLSLWRNRRFEISNCLFSRRASALDSARHYCLNASCDIVGQTGNILRNGLIHGNKLYNSGMSVAGWDINISGNVCVGTSYGAGIATYDRPVADAARVSDWLVGNYNVINNICSDATGVDADGFETAGMEIGGPYSTCVGNISYNNAGQGIRWFGYQGVCANNVCYNNGTAGGASKGPYTQAGLTAYITVASPARALYSARYSLIANNICFDTGPGNQLYGYSENTSFTDLLVGMNVTGNKVTENVTGTGYLINSAANNSYDFDQWDTYNPTVTPSSGAITKYTATGRYSRRGGVTFVNITILLDDNGTAPAAGAAGYATVSLPVTGINDAALSFAALPGYNSVTGKTLMGFVAAPAATSFVLRQYDATYPGSTGHTLIISGWYTTSAVG